MTEVIKVGNVEVNKVSIDKFEFYTDFKVTRKCSGKMAGLWALNTSMTINPRCKALAKNEKYICHKCYAQQFLGYRKSCKARFEKNYKAVNKELFKYVPDLEDAMWQKAHKVCRIEEFGDLGTVTQAVNYLLIVIANPGVTFGWWTKHPMLIKQAMELLALDRLPDNLSMVASSRKMNAVEKRYKNYPFFDHIFTVFRKDYCEEHGTVINCGAHSCIKCLQCYRKDGDFYVNEMLKSDQMKK